MPGIDVTPLNQNLRYCEEIYSQYKDVDKQQLMLKLALLETCGWLEQCLDSLYNEIAVNDKYQEDKRKRIDRIHGFGIDSIQDALIYLIGIVNYSKLEQSLERELFENMKSSLGSLKKARDVFAHTSYVSDQSYLGFSQIRKHIDNIIKGLSQVQSYLIKSKFIPHENKIFL